MHTPNRPEDIPAVTAGNYLETLLGATGSWCARASQTQPLTLGPVSEPEPWQGWAGLRRGLWPQGPLLPTAGSFQCLNPP